MRETLVRMLRDCPCEEFATKLQARKYDYLLDAVWLMDADFMESENPIFQSVLDQEAYELGGALGL